jgi:hypothetical protein
MHEYLVMQLSMQKRDLDIQMVDAPIAFNFSTFPLVLGHNQRSQNLGLLTLNFCRSKKGMNCKVVLNFHNTNFFYTQFFWSNGEI